MPDDLTHTFVLTTRDTDNLRPDLREALDASWERNKDAYRWLADRDQDARQTAIDGDAQRRHGRQRRLIVAAREMHDYLSTYVHLSPETVRRKKAIGDALAEFADTDAGPVAVETEAEREVTRLREENEQYHEATAEAKRELYASQAEVEQLTRWLADSKDEVERLRGIEAALTARWQKTIHDRDGTIEALRAENKELRADVMELESRNTIDAGQHPVGSEWFDSFREAMEDVVSYWRGSHPDLNRRIRVLVKAWEAGGKVYVPLDERLSKLKDELAASHATIAELSAREAETAKRCEAVVAAVEGLGGDRRSIKFGYGGWIGIQEYRLSALRQAVDALRPATATEAGRSVENEYCLRIDELTNQLAAATDREDDTGRRFDALIVACDKHLAYWSGFYRPDLVTLRQAVEDARRPATTEANT